MLKVWRRYQKCQAWQKVKSRPRKPPKEEKPWSFPARKLVIEGRFPSGRIEDELSCPKDTSSWHARGSHPTESGEDHVLLRDLFQIKYHNLSGEVMFVNSVANNVSFE